MDREVTAPFGRLADLLATPTESRSAAELSDIFSELVRAVPDDIVAAARQKMVVKKQPERFKRFVELMTELLKENPPLIPSGPFEDRYEVFLDLVNHVERLWLDAADSFTRESYATAVFLSITCLEETGKVGTVRFQLGVSDALLEEQRKKASSARRRDNPFFSHRDKLVLAAGSGALVNSRLDRILGMTRVLEFLDSVEAGVLRYVRERALYVAAGAEGPVIPNREFDRDEAVFYVVLAGECMAEVLGFLPSEWKRLLDRVRSFERSIGIEPE